MFKFLFGRVMLVVMFLFRGLLAFDRQNAGFAKVVAPAFSISASGTVGKVFTYGEVRGIQYVREWFSPYNPQTVKQVNLRLAFKKAVKYWQDTLLGSAKEGYIAGAKGTKDTGFSLFMGRAQVAYIAQLGVTKVPLSVAVTGVYPDDVITWTEDV